MQDDAKAIEIVSSVGSTAKIAITEGHLSLRPRNTNPILHEWLAGLYSARVMNLYERHGDRVEVATLADFFGMRWTVNAVMLGSPGQTPFLMPAGIIMRLFKRYGGREGLRVPSMTGSLDISASRTGDEVYIHVVNTDLHHAEKAEIRLAGSAIRSARVLEIAPDDLGAYVDHDHADTFDPVEHEVQVETDAILWRFPPVSVSIVVLTRSVG